MLGPAWQLADTVIEDTSTGMHRIEMALPEVLDSDEVAIAVSLGANGRNAARLGLLGRDAILRSEFVNESRMRKNAR